MVGKPLSALDNRYTWVTHLMDNRKDERLNCMDMETPGLVSTGSNG